jgi:hypothetical protein
MTIIPSKTAIEQVKKIENSHPDLYDYIDDIGKREDFISNGCIYPLIETKV